MVSYLNVNLQTNFVFDLARLPTETARVFSSSCFWYLFNASSRIFEIFSFAQSRKILSTFSNLSAILKQQKEKLCNDDVNLASVL